MPEVLNRANDARVAPARVLARHSLHKLRDGAGLARPTRPSLGSPVVLPCDELAVPSQDGLRRDDAGELPKPFAAEGLPLDGELASLGVGQTQAPVAEALAQHLVLGAQVLDRR
jgi:hypothetical protein